MPSTLPARLRTELKVGTHIGKHLRVHNVLGQGGAAVVYEALHTRLDAMVAVKVIDVAPTQMKEAVLRLEREARVCAQIEDRHVPKVFDVGELEDGRPYIVMERVYGETLEEMLRRGPLEPFLALEITRELLCALASVHRNGIVHRDIKPANVIARCDERGVLHVHLMDFGVSTMASADKTEPAITYEGVIVGTPLYMAPEQLSDEGVDARTDLYAVGVILYEMLTGVAPFSGHSTAEVMAAVLRRDFVPLEQRWSRAPEPLASLVSRALAEKPSDRFASSEQMHDALVEIIASAYRRPSVAGASLPAPIQRPSPATIAAAFGAVLGLSVLLVSLSSRDEVETSRSPVAAAVSQSRVVKPATTVELPITSPAAETVRLPHVTIVETTTISASTPTESAAALRAETSPRASRDAQKPAESVENEGTVNPAIDMEEYLRELDTLRTSLESAAPAASPARSGSSVDAIPENPFEP